MLKYLVFLLTVMILCHNVTTEVAKKDRAVDERSFSFFCPIAPNCPLVCKYIFGYSTGSWNTFKCTCT